MPGPDRSDDELDWFGQPLHPTPREPVSCPRCGETFTDRPAYASHLTDGHGVRLGRRDLTVPIGRLRRWWDSLGYLPLWFVLLLDALVVALVVAALWPFDSRIALYAGALATLPVALVLSHRMGR